MTLVLDKALEQLQWYGRGPHENYPDRQTGAAIALHRSTVTDQYVPYPKVQETGNKCDVRWLTLTDEDGSGLMIKDNAPMGMSALHYTPADLQAARHTHELKKRPEVILCLDAGASGLGNGSCGPGPLPEYIYTSRKTEFGFIIRPIRTADNVVELGRQTASGR